MITPGLSVLQRIDVVPDADVAEVFQQARRMPCEVAVSFSGGTTRRCWLVNREDGTYRAAYLPTAGYFSLVLESDFDLLDIGVHGPTLGCFGAV